MNPEDKNPYDFILNNPNSAKKTKFAVTSFKQRLIVVIAGLLILVVIAVVVLNLLSSSSSKSANPLLQLAATQQDILDIAKTGSGKTKDQSMIVVSETISIVCASHYNETNAYIAKTSLAKTSAAKITALRDKTYKTSLDNATKNGDYEAVYKQLLANKLNTYKTQIRAAYTSSSKQTLKTQLNNEYQEITTITDTL
jgi:hypothetical protein